MLFADDITLVAHSAEEMQSVVEKFARAASHAIQPQDQH